MSEYSISDLEKYSGIKAHTIRIWEQRYNILKPKRTDGNTRYYDDRDLKRILNIASMRISGIKISEINKMGEKEISLFIDEKIKQNNTGEELNEYFINALIICSLNFDQNTFEKIFSNSLIKLGIEKTYVLVILPFLNRIGLLWNKSAVSPAQEHFVTELIRMKLMSIIDAISLDSKGKKIWLLFLPAQESHEVGLLFSYYLLRVKKIKVIYLGANVPLESLKEAVRLTGATDLYFFMVSNQNKDEFKKYTKSLSDTFKLHNIHISCKTDLIKGLKLPSNCNFIEKPDYLINRIN